METTPHQHLGRVLRNETNVASLLAYCTTLDPRPLGDLLTLDKPISTAVPEVSARKFGRLDLVLGSDEGVLAVVEIKISATKHGDHFDRYGSYADSVGARRILLDLESAETAPPEGWQRISLDEIFRCWSTSENEAARVISREIASVLGVWRKQSIGRFGAMDPAMTAVVLRRVAAELSADLEEVTARSTAGGQPSLMAFDPHPDDPTASWFCVDLRSHAKFDPSRSWILRAGVHVAAGDDVARARLSAHRLATVIEPALTVEALRDRFTAAGHPELATAVADTRPLKDPRDREAAVTAWLDAAERHVSGQLPQHPVFHHDWGRRLAAQFEFRVPDLDAGQLATAVRLTMDHLRNGSR